MLDRAAERRVSNAHDGPLTSKSGAEDELLWLPQRAGSLCLLDSELGWVDVLWLRHRGRLGLYAVTPCTCGLP